MATQWKGPHFIVIAAASALAFGGGYMMAGRSRPPASPPIATNTSNGAEPSGLPGFDTNDQAPRRPDENELIARNAEPLDGAEAPQGAGNSSSRSQPERRTPPPPPPREQPADDKPPPTEPVEDQGFDPDDR